MNKRMSWKDQTAWCYACTVLIASILTYASWLAAFFVERCVTSWEVVVYICSRGYVFAPLVMFWWGLRCVQMHSKYKLVKSIGAFGILGSIGFVVGIGVFTILQSFGIVGGLGYAYY